ncbi:hypothetical protein DXA38_21230 [[Clostridium] innocuum]|uniref:Transposase n=1 Tax=Clostridium innocuum TaxID=1522 RepID=A0A3E2VEL8_CLOIN|nr:hypothetical protein DXA38_21230 [[Clostridium] innocuum]RHV63878.1 hypothetical protein DXB22_11400 [Clostridiaceae bacterium OM02-2AC]
MYEKIKQGNPTIEGINGRLDYPFHKHLKVKVSLYLCFYCMQHIAKYNKRKGNRSKRGCRT